MKKTLLLCTALLALTAPAAYAGLDLTWTGCNQSTIKASTITFDCTGGGTNPYPLYGCFQSPTAISTFVAMDILIDLQINDDPGIPTFWHYEGGGCNASGLVVSPARPGGATICPSATHLNPWGTGGADAAAAITGYQPGFGGANRARLAMSIARNQTNPIAINSGQNYFAFELRFFMDGATEWAGGACAGCTKSATIVWNQATLLSASASSIGPEAATIITSADPSLVSPCVGVNNGGGASNCQATPARSRTWGSIKALYR